MITITDRATQHLYDQRHPNHPMAWVLVIRWDRGDVDNHRNADGSAKWVRTPSRGWTLDTCNHPKEKLEETAQLLAQGIYAEVIGLFGPTFPGGVIDLESNELTFRANAV
jgi:hypothetical protein